LVGATIYLVRETHRIPVVTLIAIALLLGGGIGNLIDRLVNEGRVIDFMNVGIGSLRTGVFNVADMAIMAGVGLIMLSALRGDRTAA
ncbi:MAG: signal peptidase II, partial [Caldilinea sp.]|nr:signal peptidase II [Caldilinea sp.]